MIHENSSAVGGTVTTKEAVKNEVLVEEQRAAEERERKEEEERERGEKSKRSYLTRWMWKKT